MSCGFDSAEGDPIGNLFLSKIGYTFMLQELLQFKVPTLLVLEGGYSLDVLGWAGETIARTLLNEITEDVKAGLQ